ncbi:cupin domain-containing protein [Rudaea sp.]|uniref:cupin domain-containing protein n=1 Tax=Rudaea sp. TaxID=2136325 RepID=UPI00321FD1A6
MPKIDIEHAPTRFGTGYPPPYDEPCKMRRRWKLGDAGGLTQFGVNLLRLPPGAWSSQRHWHSAEDEFVWVVEGEGVLVTDEGEQPLRPGDCAAFPAGVRNGHHIQNRSGRDLVLLEVGSRRPAEDGCVYPDIDLVLDRGSTAYRHRDGRPYADSRTARSR